MNRRSFLQSILVTGIAPAIVRASSLMPIKVVEEPRIWYSSFFSGDDPEALLAAITAPPMSWEERIRHPNVISAWSMGGSGWEKHNGVMVWKG